jgi:hypothetical protein
MIATAAVLMPETTIDDSAYDFSGRYMPLGAGRSDGEVAHMSGIASDPLLAVHRDMIGFVSEHCRPAVSAMVAYADYLLAVAGNELAPERRALLQLIKSDGSDLLRGIGAIVGPSAPGR